MIQEVAKKSFLALLEEEFFVDLEEEVGRVDPRKIGLEYIAARIVLTTGHDLFVIFDVVTLNRDTYMTSKNYYKDGIISVLGEKN